METGGRSVYNNLLADLIAVCPRTAAAYLPLVIWRDVFYHDNHYSVSLDEPANVDRANEAIRAESAIFRHNDFCSLYLVRQGCGTHIINGVPYGIARGDVYTMGVGMEHYFAGCENLRTDTIHFSADLFDAPVLDVLTAMPGFDRFFLAGTLHPTGPQPHYGRWLHLAPDDYILVSRMIAEIRTEWQSGTPSGAMMTRCLFLRLLVHLARMHGAFPEKTSRQNLPASAHSETIIAAAVRYLDEHFTEPIRIPQVAERVFLSHDRFTKVFAEVMGRPPRDYLHHLRLERAKALLSTTDLSIMDIAHASGFGEVTYFIREFRKRMRITPGAYRRQRIGDRLR